MAIPARLTAAEEAKRSDYADTVVPHYWVVDLKARVTHVMAEPRGGDHSQRRVPFGKPIEILPALGLDVTID